MALASIFGSLGELEKFTYEIYSDEGYQKQVGGAKTVLFNPSTFFEEYKNEFDKQASVNASDKNLKFKFSGGKDLKIQLLLDATGASTSGKSSMLEVIKANPEKPLFELIKAFKADCYDIKGSEHKPNYLKLYWGTFKFQGVLTALKVTYTLFQSNGEPIRAKLDCTFASTTSLREQVSETAPESPDLTHYRTMESNTHLPLETDKIYKNDRMYLEVARVNKLNNFRRLKQGSNIHFPPIEK